MNGFMFAVTCPRCGAECEVVTVGKVVRGTDVAAILRCPECHPSHAEWSLHVLLRPMQEHVGEPQGCGTVAGYQRHLRHHTAPCGACRDAWARWDNPTGATLGRMEPYGVYEADAARARERRELLAQVDA